MGWLAKLQPVIIPHPVDWFSSIDQLPICNTSPTVLFMNRLERNKAPELLVEAMAVIRKRIPDAKAVFVGATRKRPDGASYLEWMRTTKQGFAACEFVGEVSRGMLPDFISRSRVVAIPSWFESYSMAAIEAMSGGRPVVVTRTTGVSELVEQSEAGLVIPPGDSAALAVALEPFLLNSSYAGMVGQAGREALRRYLAPDIIATQREMVYQMAIDRSNGKATSGIMHTQCNLTP
jgi:glycosyltransferase involved in cell wall biosynthesis